MQNKGISKITKENEMAKNNKIIDLNDHLFEQLERLLDAEDSEEIEREVKRSRAINNIATCITANAAIALKAQKHVDEYGNKSNLPDMLMIGKGQ